MAGKKGRSGRKPKPTVVHIAAGTHRDDRHGKIDEKYAAAGAPPMPDFQNVYAKELWIAVVGELVSQGVAAAIDGAMLQAMCEMWGLYRLAYAIAESQPLDKDARISATQYYAKFESAASCFGLNPADRARIRPDKPKPTGLQARKRG